MTYGARVGFRLWAIRSLVLLFAVFVFTTQASAQLGSKMPAFRLQATDSQFYGVDDAGGTVTILYFLGHNCAPCIGGGPAIEQNIWQAVRTKPNVQMMGLDVWNGTPAELSLYQNLTGITFPLLREAALQGRRTSFYAGARLSDMFVLDQDNVVRLVINGEGETDHPRVLEMVESLQKSTPIITMPTTRLYFGLKMHVGETKSADVILQNTGAGALDITGLSSTVADVIMDPPAFTLSPYEEKTVNIVFAPTLTGTFEGTVTLQHKNGNVQTLQVPILKVDVEGQVWPRIDLAQTRLDFGDADLNQKIEKAMTLLNTGDGVLRVSDVQSDLDGFSVSETQFDIPTNGSKDVVVTFNPQVEGAFSGQIHVLSNDPDQATRSVLVTGTGVFIPADPRTDFDGSGRVDFPDFVALVRVFGATDAGFDLDGSGRVDFGDFLIFAGSFGKAIQN